MTKAEFENKLAAAPEVDPDGQDRAMIEEAAAQDDGSFISLGAFKSLMGYNGKISLRIPRSLHMKLAEDARQEGVSLNQYALYKLSR